MSENVLHVENVTMQFGGVVAVNNLSIDVNKNEILSAPTVPEKQQLSTASQAYMSRQTVL